jgi:hypothetical protein
MPRIDTNARPTESELTLSPGTVGATSATERNAFRSIVSSVTAETEIGTVSSDSSRLRAVTVICSMVASVSAVCARAPGAGSASARASGAKIAALLNPPSCARLTLACMIPPKKPCQSV